MTAEYELLQDRLISGKGLLKIPTDVQKYRTYTLFTEVVRKPRQPYLNLQWNPPRSRYANMAFFRDDYLVKIIPVEFPKQSFDDINDICGQTMIAVKCAYKGILQSIQNLGYAISGTPGGVGLTPTTIDNEIAEYGNLQNAWDEIRIVCYADTAISLRLFGLQYDVCEGTDNTTIPAPTPPQLEYPPFPVGQEIEGISPAYDGETDGGNSVPYFGDVPPEPEPEPGSEPGVQYTITFTYDLFNSSNQIINTINESFTVRGPVTDYGITQDLRDKGAPSAAPGGYAIGTQADGSPQLVYQGYGGVGSFTVGNFRDLVFTP